MNQFLIHRNKRKEANDFSMEHPCDFCKRFAGQVVEIPGAYIAKPDNKFKNANICSTCLHDMQEAIAKNMRDHFKSDFQEMRENEPIPFDANPIPFGIGAYFTELRFNSDHHIGLGDIRITLSQQEDIENYCKKLGEKI